MFSLYKSYGIFFVCISVSQRDIIFKDWIKIGWVMIFFTLWQEPATKSLDLAWPKNAIICNYLGGRGRKLFFFLVKMFVNQTKYWWKIKYPRGKKTYTIWEISGWKFENLVQTPIIQFLLQFWTIIFNVIIFSVKTRLASKCSAWKGFIPHLQ